MFLKKHIFFLLTIWFIAKGAHLQSQNLVPNWSFEEYNSCPNVSNYDCSNTAPIIPSLKDWFCALTHESTPDYLNSCASYPFNVPNNNKGYQLAHSGNAYLGAFTNKMYNSMNNNVEYIQCKLADSLKANIAYCVQFFVNRSNNPDYASSNFGALFTDTIINIPGLPYYINATPQVSNPFGNFVIDTLNWTKVEGSFIANGGESFLTLGIFGPNSGIDTLYDPKLPLQLGSRFLMPYYYIDDVSVEAVSKVQAGTDKNINCGDIVTLGADSTIGAEFKWFPSVGLNTDAVAFPQASPTITTQYIVQKTQCKIVTYDTVLVTVNNACPLIIDDMIIPNVFSPNDDGVNDVWEFSLGIGFTLNELEVYNRWGNLIYTAKDAISSSSSGRLGGAWDGRTTSGVSCSEGVYFYTLKYTDANGEQQTKNGYISLFR